MKIGLIFLTISCISLLSLSSANEKDEIKIEWTDTLLGDFSFKENWSYPEGIYVNDFGQVSCDGFCPEGTDQLLDNNGKIRSGKLKAYYELVDTTHQFHSIQCDAWCYEWDGTNIIEAKQINTDSVVCNTMMSMSTHCSLHMCIADDYCYPSIQLASIAATGNIIYKCIGGYIKIDKECWKKGIVKAEFDFQFYHTEDPNVPMYWKGMIYTKIQKE